MSAEATSWAYKVTVVVESSDPALQESLKMAPKFLLVTLANYADEAHSSFPSFNTLAERMSCSRSTVIEAMKTLEKHGLIIVQKRRRENTSHTSNRYHMPVDSWAPKRLTPSPDSGLGAVDNSPVEDSAPSAESAPAQSGIRTPLNRQPNHRSFNDPVPEVSPEEPVDNFGTGQNNHPGMPKTLTHGKPFQPADVFASVGHRLPATFDDVALERLAAEILSRAASRVLDPTGYVIRVVRNWHRPNYTAADLVDRGEWMEIIDRIDRDRQTERHGAVTMGARF